MNKQIQIKKKKKNTPSELKIIKINKLKHDKPVGNEKKIQIKKNDKSTKIIKIKENNTDLHEKTTEIKENKADLTLKTTENKVITTVIKENPTEIETIIENIYQCKYCNKILTSKRNLQIHEFNICQHKDKLKCDKCNKTFLSMQYLERHTKICIANLTCPKCKKTLGRKFTYLQHIKKCNKQILD